ncbi:helix-turn-helix transcriptional regulator [Listeria booriae]|nr:helix-turn-helix transcriptional regulator [Listeria booriae]MBC6306447.1 helix-turn-helix transcriptional regulator [Listeria booriae]
MPIRSLRVRMNLTQDTAAKKLGVAVPTLRKWEDDTSDMPIHFMIKIAEMYKYPIDYIFFGKHINLIDILKGEIVK